MQSAAKIAIKSSSKSSNFTLQNIYGIGYASDCKDARHYHYLTSNWRLHWSGEDRLPLFLSLYQIKRTASMQAPIWETKRDTRGRCLLFNKASKGSQTVVNCCVAKFYQQTLLDSIHNSAIEVKSPIKKFELRPVGSTSITEAQAKVTVHLLIQTNI